MPQLLELFGRFELDPQASGIDGGQIHSRCVIPFLRYMKADQDEFLADLRSVVATDPGGFATFGAARVVWELYGGDALEMPAAWPLIDAGIEFRLARGQPPGLALTGYELQRFDRLQDQRGEAAG